MSKACVLLAFLLCIVFAQAQLSLKFADAGVKSSTLTIGVSNAPTMSSPLSGTVVFSTIPTVCASDYAIYAMDETSSAAMPPIIVNDNISESVLKYVTPVIIPLTKTTDVDFTLKPTKSDVDSPNWPASASSLHNYRQYILACTNSALSVIALSVTVPVMTTAVTMTKGNKPSLNVYSKHSAANTEFSIDSNVSDILYSMISQYLATANPTGDIGLYAVVDYDIDNLKTMAALPATLETRVKTSIAFKLATITAYADAATTAYTAHTVALNNLLFNVNSPHYASARSILLAFGYNNKFTSIEITTLGGSKITPGTFSKLVTSANGDVYQFSTPTSSQFIFYNVVKPGTNATVTMRLHQLSPAANDGTVADYTKLGAVLQNSFGGFKTDNKNVVEGTNVKMNMVVSLIAPLPIILGRTLSVLLSDVTYTYWIDSTTLINAAAYSFPALTSSKQVVPTGVTHPVDSYEMFIEPPHNNVKGQVTIFVNVYAPSNTDKYKLNYHIHTGRVSTGDTDCTKGPAGHLDPSFKGMTSPEEFGNLSGRHSPLTHFKNYDVYTDPYISVDANTYSSAVGRSIVLHNALEAGGPRVMCGNINDGTAATPVFANVADTTIGFAFQYFRYKPTSKTYLSIVIDYSKHTAHFSKYTLNTTTCATHGSQKYVTNLDGVFSTPDNFIMSYAETFGDVTSPSLPGRSIVLTPKNGDPLICLTIGTGFTVYAVPTDAAGNVNSVISTLYINKAKFLSESELMPYTNAINSYAATNVETFISNDHRFRVKGQSYIYNADDLVVTSNSAPKASKSLLVEYLSVVPPGLTNLEYRNKMVATSIPGGGTFYVSNESTVVPYTCFNNEMDGTESDVDCGTDECGGCALGKRCSSGSNCVSQTCVNNYCANPSSAFSAFSGVVILAIISVATLFL